MIDIEKHRTICIEGSSAPRSLPKDENVALIGCTENPRRSLLLLALLRVLRAGHLGTGRGAELRRTAGLILIILILIVVLVVLIVKVGIVEVVEVLVLERLAGEKVDGVRDDAVLEVLADLVVELETLVQLVEVGLVIVQLAVLGRLGWVEKVEETTRRARIA